MPERQIRSIPPRTMRNVWSGQTTASTPFRGSSLNWGISLTRKAGIGQLSQSTRTPQEYSFDINRHVVSKSTKEKPRPSVLPENERITWQVEQVDDYNGQGDLGLILQYSGVELSKTPFLRMGGCNLDNVVFSQPARYRGRNTLLFLSTFGDIFEIQVAVKKDANPFFQEEIYLPDLATTYNPRSMTVIQNNRLVIVSYKLRPT